MPRYVRRPGDRTWLNAYMTAGIWNRKREVPEQTALGDCWKGCKMIARIGFNSVLTGTRVRSGGDDRLRNSSLEDGGWPATRAAPPDCAESPTSSLPRSRLICSGPARFSFERMDFPRRRVNGDQRRPIRICARRLSMQSTAVNGIHPDELRWVRQLVSLLRHPKPKTAALTQYALILLSRRTMDGQLSTAREVLSRPRRR
jgi:hypothetical protein